LLNIRDQDFINNSNSDSEADTQDLNFKTETSRGVHFLKIFIKMSLPLLNWFFFKFLAFFQPALVVSYLKIQKWKLI